MAGSNGVDLEMLRHEIEREEKLANSLWHTIAELKIEDQAKPRVALIELAKRPEVRCGSNNTKRRCRRATRGNLGCVCGRLL